MKSSVDLNIYSGIKASLSTVQMQPESMTVPSDGLLKAPFSGSMLTRRGSLGASSSALNGHGHATWKSFTFLLSFILE